MNIQLRTASQDDANAIAVVHVESWRAAYRGEIPDGILDALEVAEREKRWVRHLASPVVTTMVATDNGAIVGFCSLRPTRDAGQDEAVAEIPTIYVLASHWSRGVGRLLCEGALTEARRRGFESVTLWVLGSNERARAFYEALGFRLDGGTKTDTSLPGVALDEVRYCICLKP